MNMREFPLRFRLTPTTIILLALIGLNLFSLTAIFSSLHENGDFSQQVLFYKQIIWVIVSWFFMLIFAFINYRSYFDVAYIVYGINIVLLVIANVFGRTAMGAQRWINIGGFNFQPSEVSKIAIIFLLASFFSSSGRRGFFKDFFVPFLFIGFNALIIMKQPDLGTALLLLFIFLIMGFCSNLPKRYFIRFTYCFNIGRAACSSSSKRLSEKSV